MTDNSSDTSNLAAQEREDVSQDLDNSPGSQLRRARERAGLSLEELSRRLCMTLGKLELLERDEYDRLPGALYVRGYIRNACKELGIDAEPVLQAFSGYSAAEEESRALLDHVRRAPVMESKPRRSLRGLALLPLLVVAGVFWWLHGRDLAPPTFSTDNHPFDTGVAPEIEEPAVDAAPTSIAGEKAPEPDPQAEEPAVNTPPVEEPESEVAASESEPAPEPLPASGTEAEPEMLPALAAAPGTGDASQLELYFDEESWIEVRDASGAVLLAKLKSAGSQVTLEGQPPFELMLGNASGTRVRYRGEPVASGPTGNRRTRKLIVGE
ncbi:RodZ domain-containing protein [Microbulbifer rhizosphaerae]|uniref:Cytoskeleton protein RodZ n=1 Tax=Microbulbifer rhizosphaerae TaxID=1562603 RepID=A0A7W4WF80_9GAMM|nr:RodZ domain-containing protein [Microbulbifer rhizosphaerae]MBB3062692.1 cytoskeleton protein RodZ [Microbulbifer rhizosphaerae]